MTDTPPTPPIHAVILTALARYTQRSGHQLTELTGLGTGRLYPALVELEQAGQIVSEWEDMPFPRRRRYRLRSAGE